MSDAPSASTSPASMSPPPSRGGYVASAIVIAVAVAGFVTGTREIKRATDPAAPSLTARAVTADVSAGAAAAPRYGDMRKADFRANAALYAGAAHALVKDLPDPMAPIELSDDERARAIADRQKRRAYDGAPPTIPHAVGQLEPTGCLVCHERGAKVAERIAPPISHARYTSCLQCHVVAEAPGPRTTNDSRTDNAFAGNAWGKGTRAWPGAPPTIPHPTSMREECASCHGSAGRLGLRSSHPWRTTCQQCHAPNAALDQRAATAETTP